MLISEGWKCGYIFHNLIFSATVLYLLLPFPQHPLHWLFNSSARLPGRTAAGYLWLDALHTSNCHESQAFLQVFSHSSYAMTDSVGNYSYIQRHTYMYILNKFNFLLSLWFMTHIDMSVDLNDSSPLPMFCLSLTLAPHLRQECFLMTVLRFQNVQVSSGAIFFSHSNFYADWTLMTQSLYCSV